MSLEPHLDLAFIRHPLAGTVLERRRTRYPYVLCKPFRMDRAGEGMLTTIVQSASGAILSEDRLVQRIAVGEGAEAHVTNQAAITVNRAVGDAVAEESLSVTVAAGGLAEVMPAPRILMPGSALRQRLSITADPLGTAIVADGFTTHDPEAMGGPGRGFRFYGGRLEIRRPDGSLLAADRFELAGPPNRFGAAERLVAHGSLLVVTADEDDRHRRILAALEAVVADLEVLAAASLLPRGAGVALRIAARDGAGLRAATLEGWSAVRQVLTGRRPDRPRW